jgi:hypothetical protein
MRRGPTAKICPDCKFNGPLERSIGRVTGKLEI